jgi:lipid A 3-O-deacylase
MRRWPFSVLAAATLMGGGLARAEDPAAAAAEDSARFTAIEENDSIWSHTDKYYTQGLSFAFLTGGIEETSAWDAPFDTFAEWGLFPSENVTSRRYEILLGQQIFTPEDISLGNPDPDDRPYAGWFYGGLGLIQDTDHRRLDHLELQVGVVGPAAFAETTQNDWHQYIGIDDAFGWDHQLHNEPGLMLTYERKYRFLAQMGDGFGADFIPEAGATVGNVMTYAQIGGMVRIGRNLQADYGPARMRPNLSGTTYFTNKDMVGKFGFYLFAGAQGRAVARNIFLDGNTFRDSRDVDSEALVADLTGGISFFWGDDVKLDVAVLRRTKEFEGQDKPFDYAGINLTVGF